ncbi:MAG: FAD-dependent monooxygenase [Flavobacteriales bacterium]|nr:FAD-dependent monooxygenase [Flavobacteriales bacterium]
MENNFDAIILGGGLAGLTLSMQLRRQNPDIRVLVLEKRDGAAPDAAHKVGESTVELATHYLREVLGLKDYLDTHQLPKHGLRFFFPAKGKNEIHHRVELGPKRLLPVPSHQLDRGILENDLIKFSIDLGNEVVMGAKVEDVALGNPSHTVTYSVDGEKVTRTARWVVDATGRGSFMKRKLGFAQTIDHDVSSVWFRVDWKIDIDTWTDDAKWHSHVEPGLRFLSTVHLMDAGYWVWIIPLVGDRTSVGIVADQAIHPFETYNKLEKALDWIATNEPQLSRELKAMEGKGNILDFKVMKHFAHGSGELYSTDRWSVVGEAGLFADPFYSPGSDFISMANTLTADLIQRDLKGEDILFRTKFYCEVTRALYDNWMPIYIGQYPLWGKAQIMVAKIFWDWGAYWSINTLLFTNNGLTDLDLLRKLTAGPTSLLRKYGELSRQMQRLFKDWLPYDNAEIADRYTDPFDLGFLRGFQEDIVEKQFDRDELLEKFDANLAILEKVAAETYRLASNQAYGTPMDLEVDPYTMSLNGDPRSASPNSMVLGRDAYIADEMRHMWIYPYPEEVMA